MAAKPFTVIGGFLGAGKTTLINRILRQASGTRFAVLVNDFGAINVDAGLIESHDGQTMALANGCICCSLADGFIATMLDLMRSPERFDHVVIEASGVSEPDRIMDFARLDRELQPDGIVVLVDAADFATRVEDLKLAGILKSQVESADLLVLNKADRASGDTLAGLHKLLRDIAGDTPQVETSGAAVPLELVLGAATACDPGAADHVHGHDHASDHGDAGSLFYTLTLARSEPIDRTAFEAFAAALPAHVLRGKGFVLLADGMHLWQKAGGEATLVPTAREPVATEIVLIGTEPLDDLSGQFERI